MFFRCLIQMFFHFLTLTLVRNRINKLPVIVQVFILDFKGQSYNWASNIQARNASKCSLIKFLYYHLCGVYYKDNYSQQYP